MRKAERLWVVEENCGDGWFPNLETFYERHAALEECRESREVERRQTIPILKFRTVQYERAEPPKRKKAGR